MNELKRHFVELHVNYRQATSDSETILNEMRQNLILRNEDVKLFSTTDDIENANYEQILQIDGKLSLAESANRMTKIANKCRRQ